MIKLNEKKPIIDLIVDSLHEMRKTDSVYVEAPPEGMVDFFNLEKALYHLLYDSKYGLEIEIKELGGTTKKIPPKYEFDKMIHLTINEGMGYKHVDTDWHTITKIFSIEKPDKNSVSITGREYRGSNIKIFTNPIKKRISNAGYFIQKPTNECTLNMKHKSPSTPFKIVLPYSPSKPDGEYYPISHDESKIIPKEDWEKFKIPAYAIGQASWAELSIKTLCGITSENDIIKKFGEEITKKELSIGYNRIIEFLESELDEKDYGELVEKEFPGKSKKLFLNQFFRAFKNNVTKHASKFSENLKNIGYEIDREEIIGVIELKKTSKIHPYV